MLIASLLIVMIIAIIWAFRASSEAHQYDMLNRGHLNAVAEEKRNVQRLERDKIELAGRVSSLEDKLEETRKFRVGDLYDRIGEIRDAKDEHASARRSWEHHAKDSMLIAQREKLESPVHGVTNKNGNIYPPFLIPDRWSQSIHLPGSGAFDHDAKARSDMARLVEEVLRQNDAYILNSIGLPKGAIITPATHRPSMTRLLAEEAMRSSIDRAFDGNARKTGARVRDGLREAPPAKTDEEQCHKCVTPMSPQPSIFECDQCKSPTAPWQAYSHTEAPGQRFCGPECADAFVADQIRCVACSKLDAFCECQCASCSNTGMMTTRERPRDGEVFLCSTECRIIWNNVRQLGGRGHERCQECASRHVNIIHHTHGPTKEPDLFAFCSPGCHKTFKLRYAL